MKMNRKLWVIFAVVCTLAMLAAVAAPACAQDEAKEKPPMYSYVGNWNIPRAQWADMEKNTAADQKTLDKAIADGTIVGYGSDVNLVHQPETPTHDDWWSTMSMAGLLNVLDKFYKSGSATAPVLSSATKHWDAIYVSRYYNWRPGSYKGAYTRVASFKLKPDAPADAVESLSKTVFVPLMEKLLADGTIVEYEIDTEAIHTVDPGNFWIDFISPTADGLDKFDAALRAVNKMHPLLAPAFGSQVEYGAHRDYLVSTTATYK
jgi:hypothetical protein